MGAGLWEIYRDKLVDIGLGFVVRLIYIRVRLEFVSNEVVEVEL